MLMSYYFFFGLLGFSKFFCVFMGFSKFFAFLWGFLSFFCVFMGFSILLIAGSFGSGNGDLIGKPGGFLGFWHNQLSDDLLNHNTNINLQNDDVVFLLQREGPVGPG